MKITIEQDNGQLIVIENNATTEINTQHEFPVRQVCVNTMIPHDNWVNELSGVAQSIVDQFHRPGRMAHQFSKDMGIKQLQDQLWEKIVKLAKVLHED